MYRGWFLRTAARSHKSAMMATLQKHPGVLNCMKGLKAAKPRHTLTKLSCSAVTRHHELRMLPRRAPAPAPALDWRKMGLALNSRAPLWLVADPGCPRLDTFSHSSNALNQ